MQQAGGITSVNGKTSTSGMVSLATTDLSDTAIISPSDNQVLTYSGSKWINQTSPSAPDATSSTPGIVQLTGDFGGTYTSPQVTNTHLASALPVNQGGTGATTQNFVDLTTSQSIGGTKTFTTKLATTALQLSASPTSGYVLTSDGSGNGSWQAPSNVSGVTKGYVIGIATALA